MSSTDGKFEYRELDPEGFETLSVISDAVNFNDWAYESIRPWCQGKILEIGSGIGNISTRFIREGMDITLSDIRSNYREFLAFKFPQLQGLNKILPVDLVHSDFSKKYESLSGVYDTVFALNVVEHIENDSQAIQNARQLLKPGGKLIILVPAFQSLYNSFDRELHHYRRYRRKNLEQLFRSNHLTVLKSFYFNAGGIPGWFVSGTIQKNRIIPAFQMRTFDKLVPLFKILDFLFLKKIGLSVVCVGTKD